MKSFLQNNNVEMYSTHNDGKSLLLKELKVGDNVRISKYKKYF